MSPDFLSSHQGSIILLTPLTDAASELLADNVPNSADTPGNTLPIEGRFFLDIAYSLLADGLTMQDAATGRMASLP